MLELVVLFIYNFYFCVPNFNFYSSENSLQIFGMMQHNCVNMCFVGRPCLWVHCMWYFK